MARVTGNGRVGQGLFTLKAGPLSGGTGHGMPDGRGGSVQWKSRLRVTSPCSIGE